jgi:hypothetical protein
MASWLNHDVVIDPGLTFSASFPGLEDPRSAGAQGLAGVQSRGM